MQCRKCKNEIPSESIYCMFCGTAQTPVKQKRKALKRANGTGTVYKLQGRRKRPWVAAKSKVIIGYYETKTAALDALSRFAGRSLDDRYNMTFAEVFEAWKKERYPIIGESEKRSYERSFAVFESLHKKKFRELRAEDFQTVIDGHMEKSNSTVSKYKLLLTQMSKWAIREELIVTDFSAYVRVPKKLKSEKEIFSTEDIIKLEADGSDAARIILMLIYTGMRIGELFDLATTDFYGDYVIGGKKTEAGRNRVIPIRKEGRKHFKYFADRASGSLLLSGYEGDKVVANFRRRNYYPLLERLGIERKTPHATRHTYTSWAVKAGVPPEMLQKILGHADYSTTANIYTHIDPEALVLAIEK